MFLLFNPAFAFYGNSILPNNLPNKQNVTVLLWMVIVRHLQLPTKVNLFNLVSLVLCLVN